MRQQYKLNPFLQFLVKIWMIIYVKKFRVTVSIDDEIKNLNVPYLLLANHVGRFDPFILNHFLSKAPHFISSDAILRDRVIGTLFKMLGAMPIKKGTRDSQIIREMAKVVQNGGALALFPESARTWTGVTNPFDISTIKLIRLLKIPVITAVMRGAYFSDPRWGSAVRKSAMHIEYKIAFRPEELKALTDEQIFETLKRNLKHDDVDYQRERLCRIDSEVRAESIERIFYKCPVCESYDGFKSKGNDFSCLGCGAENTVDDFGFLASKGKTQLPFDNNRDWLRWQDKSFAELIYASLSDTTKPLFSSVEMHMENAMGYKKMKSHGNGILHFYADRLVFEGQNFREELLIENISSLSPQFKERIELYFGETAYRFTSVSRNESGMKWELAIHLVWAKYGQQIKFSPYFKDLVNEVTSFTDNPTD